MGCRGGAIDFEHCASSISGISVFDASFRFSRPHVFWRHRLSRRRADSRWSHPKPARGPVDRRRCNARAGARWPRRRGGACQPRRRGGTWRNALSAAKTAGSSSYDAGRWTSSLGVRITSEEHQAECAEFGRFLVTFQYTFSQGIQKFDYQL